MRNDFKNDASQAEKAESASFALEITSPPRISRCRTSALSLRAASPRTTLLLVQRLRLSIQRLLRPGQGLKLELSRPLARRLATPLLLASPTK